MKDYATQFYKSKAWQKCRASFIAKRTAIDGGMCQRCHERLGFIVHHIVEITPENINDADVTFNHRNMQYVCHECHNDIHGAFKKSARRVMFDENGDVLDAYSPHVGLNGDAHGDR